MDRGILMFAHNNYEIDYFKIACANALMAKKNLDIDGVALLTDIDTHDYITESFDPEFVNSCFDKIIISDRDYSYDSSNKRNFSDTRYDTKILPFHNCDHWLAYQVSPFKETIFVDADYLIMSDRLNLCWGSEHDFMINHNVRELAGKTTYSEKYLDSFGIRLYWATCIYFRKSPTAETAFNIVKNVFDNYMFYKQLYQFPGAMFRNDFAFSIAVHMLNGFNENNIVTTLPDDTILMVSDIDDIHNVNGVNDITFLLEKPDCEFDYMLSRIKGTDVHIINKWAITRHADELIKLYE